MDYIRSYRLYKIISKLYYVILFTDLEYHLKLKYVIRIIEGIIEWRIMNGDSIVTLDDKGNS